MTNKPIEGMTALSVSDRLELFGQALLGNVARAYTRRSVDGIPGFEAEMRKYFPELFAEPLVPGKGSLIKAGEVFTLSCSSVPEYEATTYQAKKDFDLKVEYEKQLELRKEELDGYRRDNPCGFDIQIFDKPLGKDYPTRLDYEMAQSDMSRRLRDEGVIEVFQCRVHHLGLSSRGLNEECIAEFYEGHWVSSTGENVKRPE